ncbi:MAG: biotin--[acetyl-CoA-carboxylase] ligase [Deltaproteobacteria bacterium]|nr:biotin--[acetyl-CoA-carboxylase] ligase [Deltaproteobacteria bacterium]
MQGARQKAQDTQHPTPYTLLFKLSTKHSMVETSNWVEELRKARKGKLIGKEILFFDRVDSTNRLGREYALKRAEEGFVILAESQAQGRGRQGRVWESPAGVNLYLSVILKPSIPPAVAPQITLLAGVASANALTRASGLEARIKWPNDIFIHGKKVAGILSEMEAEGLKIRFVILGMGVNVNWKMEEVPPDLQGLASSLMAEGGRKFSRALVAGELLEELEREYELFLREGFSPRLREEWNRLSWVNQKWVTVKVMDKEFAGQVLGLDADGALLLRDRKGNRQRLVAGDVSLRL